MNKRTLSKSDQRRDRPRALGVAILAIILVGGCAVSRPLERAEPSPCGEFLRQVDDTVARSGVRDAQYARMAGFPYLRADRFLASFDPRALDARAFAEWRDQLAALDQEARAFEIGNLPRSAVSDLDAAAQRLLGTNDVLAAVRRCGRQLARLDAARPGVAEALAAVAAVPDEYRTVWRALGLYPVTRLFVSAGIARWHDQARQTLATPIEALPVSGRLVQFRPAFAPDVARSPARIAGAPRSALGLPAIGDEELHRLFALHAPIWEIDVVSEADRLGRPRWADDGLPGVATGDPVAYTYRTYARLRDAVLMQLNYVIWFPERPRTGQFDILGGRLDGITWRVTLAPDGTPLLYDAIHNCGCYHMYFPTLGLTPRPVERGVEPPLIAQYVTPGNGPLVVRIANRTHYIERVYRTAASPPAVGISYRLDDYDVLRALPAGDRRRSLFDAEGLVPGTSRPERWLLWPMGVPDPGAMRQRGHHAVAFIGRRHFDEPRLIERIFEWSP